MNETYLTQSNEIKVAVIMPTFNGQLYLEKQLDSLSKQEGVAIELFVFDDCSTDNTLNILSEYKGAMHINVIQNFVNSGGTGKNLLENIRDIDLGLVEGCRYFAFCDQDDIWCSDKLIRAISKIVETQVGLFYSNLTLWSESKGEYGEIKKNYPFRRYDFLFEGGSAGCTYVLTEKFFKFVRSFLADFPIEKITRVSHDWIVYLLARHYDYGVYQDSVSKILYRIHAENQYGHLSGGGLGANVLRLKMVKDGFYQLQISNATFFLRSDSVEFEIYSLYCRSFFTRLYVLLKYNFSLMKRPSKFLKFFIISMLFVDYFDFKKN